MLLLSMACLTALCAQAQANYVDMGLPSGTKWKSTNELNTTDVKSDFFTYDEATVKYGNQIPSKTQWEELKTLCKWSWNGNGYDITGPNGNSITLPASGYRFCFNGIEATEPYGTKSYGRYWSSSPSDAGFAWYISFSSSETQINSYFCCFGYTVRLVKMD